MQIISTIKTKAKWSLSLSDHGVKMLPTLGYYSGGKPVLYRHNTLPQTELATGENVILKGLLRPEGVGRGRSSVTLYLEDPDGIQYQTAASGMNSMFLAILDGHMTIEKDADGTPWFLGEWTCAKQGTEVSLIPYIKG